ncbi:Na+/H+ antiporter subunit E [Kribbella sp. NPDC049174]|uniref:Na+/H+ antiporter subunit E n=1 Tax=Kribbella sp. NPDC049174 TaxID=3364112 RepID=UPI003724C0D0
MNRKRDESNRPARPRGLQLPVLLWLTLVWVALWGDLSVANVLGGLAVALVVCLVFPLPPLRMHLHVRPLWLGWLVVQFLADVVAASAEVAWKTLQFHRQPRNAVIEVDLRTRSDFVLTIVAEMVSLVPGSLVVEARRSTHTLFLHVLDARDTAGVDKMRKQVFALERRVVLALGAEIQQLDEPPGGPR